MTHLKTSHFYWLELVDALKTILKGFSIQSQFIPQLRQVKDLLNPHQYDNQKSGLSDITPELLV